MAKLFLHVGLHRTATTFLQRQIFPFWPGIEYLGKPWPVSPSVSRELLLRIFAAGEQTRLLYSSEALAGPLTPQFGVRREEVAENWILVQERALAALGERLPEARILIGFRHHEGFLSSLYRVYLRNGGTVRIEEFFDPQNDEGIIKHEDLLFERRLRVIDRFFEREPFVFFYDDLIQRPDEIFEAMALFFGTPVPSGLESRIDRRLNAGLVGRRAKMLRLLNHLDARTPSNRGPKGRRSGILRSKIARMLRIDPVSLSRLLPPGGESRLPDGHERFLRREYAEDLEVVSKRAAGRASVGPGTHRATTDL